MKIAFQCLISLECENAKQGREALESMIASEHIIQIESFKVQRVVLADKVEDRSATCHYGGKSGK